FKLMEKSDMAETMASLRNVYEDSVKILRDNKYVLKILRGPQGIEKLQRLRIFHATYPSDIIEFSGNQLSEIIYGKGWEYKLAYLEVVGNVERLTRFGLKGSHLSP